MPQYLLMGVLAAFGCLFTLSVHASAIEDFIATRAISVQPAFSHQYSQSCECIAGKRLTSQLEKNVFNVLERFHDAISIRNFEHKKQRPRLILAGIRH